VKIKFDENISVRLVQAIRRLETDSTIEISSVLEDYGNGLEDPEWMFRFRDEGGVAMVSGDHNILQKPINLVAYMESGLVSIWPPPGWPKLKRWGQAALLFRWWPSIKQRILASSSGDRWRIQMQWTPDFDAFIAIHDPRVDGRGDPKAAP
jgi:PIN like domain